EVIIVDEFTGRMMPGRRYSEGLHQAIEAKEGVKVQKESQTMATITFQNLFRLYKKLAGMTGTAVTEAEEFHKIYNLETIVIPTNKPNIRKDSNDLIYRTEEDKFAAVIRDIKERNKLGQPILVGTISIEKNEVMADMMAREGLHPEVLNAKNHLKEAQIIAQAGQRGAITLATNMAGRGVDIILGGNPPVKEEQAAVIALGGLHVIGTERHESRRIDNQLRGRAGRQGDPGSSQFFVSTDDDLMRIFGGDRMKNLMKTLRVPADVPIENKMISRSIESAQKKVEGNNFDLRKHLVEYDDVINKHREAIYRRRREILEMAENLTAIRLGGEIDSNNKTESKELITEPARNLSTIILDMVAGEIALVVNFHTAGDNISDWNITEICEVMKTIFSAGPELKTELDKMIAAASNKDKLRTGITDYLIKLSLDNYENLALKFKDSNINFAEIEKGILIRSIDQMWVEHLETMDYMRRGIGLRGYGQRDPLVEYKKEAYRLYQELNDLIQKQIVYSIYKTAAALAASPNLINLMMEGEVEKPLNFQGAAKEMNRQAEANDNFDLVHEKVKDASGQKVGRNDPCPCGSGKKFKNCHGK
ncbi:MAG: SEC-C metal-binding domain-containing protein, partial [Candidatus Falkowbacteria bacterium]|nr:SEC-C metal-binding domain-containing protein [Candidatus Falkowbacteria bacterium]